MDVYRKERSSRQHMKVDLHSQDSQEQDGGLLLANPMAGMDISPSPAGSNHHHHTGGVSGSSGSSISPGHAAQSLHSGATSQPLSRASNERSSFKNKSRPKSPSLFRFFVRGHSTPSGIGRKVSYDEEDYDGSSGSEHEDPFSPRGVTTPGDFIANRHTTDVPKSPSDSLQRQYKRQNNSSTGHAQRDSGFSSERESISHMKEDKDRDSHLYHNMDDLNGGSTANDYHPAGMDALEVLQNQIQLLVKQDCDDVDTDSVSMFEQVIAGLSRQVEDLSNSVDCLRQSDQNLRLSLRLAEQRALEAEIKLGLALDRSQRAEQKCLKLAFKCRGITKKYRELEKFQQKKAVLQQMELATPSPKRSPLAQQRTSNSRSPPQRVQSQTQYDRNNPSDIPPAAIDRPSTVQGYHSGEREHIPSTVSITSLSHTETRV